MYRVIILRTLSKLRGGEVAKEDLEWIFQGPAALPRKNPVLVLGQYTHSPHMWDFKIHSISVAC